MNTDAYTEPSPDFMSGLEQLVVQAAKRYAEWAGFSDSARERIENRIETATVNEEFPS